MKRIAQSAHWGELAVRYAERAWMCHCDTQTMVQQYGSVHMTVHNHLYDMIHVAVQRPVCINSYYGLLASLQGKEFNARTQNGTHSTASHAQHSLQITLSVKWREAIAFSKE